MAVLRWLATGLLYAPAIAAAVVPLPDDSAAQIPLGGLHDTAATTQSQSQSQRKLHGRFLHITDFHPDEYYKKHTSTEEGVACHRGHGVAGKYGAETTDCDTPMSLVNATFAWLEANMRDQIDFVIWTGDSARHDSDETIPRSPAQVLGTNRVIADKFKSTFTHPKGDAVPIPVIPTFGNNDILPHNVLLPGPNQWLSYYTDIWKAFIPEEQVHSFEFGGWFYVEVIPGKLAVFSLNTLYFFDRNAGIDDCAHPSEPGFKQLEWLKVQLGFLRRRGMKAILMGHVPPARTESKMLWDETCWQKYTLWLQQYRDVVVSGIYGHMNIDHFLIQDTKELNIPLLQGKVKKEDVNVNRVAMGDELSVSSAADYLQELRSHWRKLEKPEIKTDELEDDDTDEEGIDDEDEDGEIIDDEDDKVEDDLETDSAGKKKKKGRKGRKGRKGKKGKSRWGERYQISLVGPSIVPNYFPTLRIVEYNITGLENAVVWADRPEGNEEYHDSAKGKKKKGKKKPKQPKDPYLIIPDPPAKTAPPGPAYSAQTLSLTGYTQYYANLTHINNDFITDEEEDDDEVHSSKKWRNGKHHGKDPKKDRGTRKFEFQVEYSTFNDSLYALADLTVNSYVDLAYRMGQKKAHKRESADELDDAADGSFNFLFGKKKKAKHNKVWLHFLRHAFVRTVDERELKKLDRPQ